MTRKMAHGRPSFGFLPATISTLLIWCILLCVCHAVQGITKVSGERSFHIDNLGNTFLKDGKPFRYISGSIHYQRVPSYYWRDRLEKMYAAGLNAIQLYIPWNYHQPEKDVFEFEGEKNVELFVNTAHEIGLLVILRAGPYICGEWDFGGLPAWILKEKPDVVFRTMDSTYIKHVENWWNVLLPRLQPLLYENGGPIIMVQIENEYGSYFACDKNYTSYLRDLAKRLLGDKTVLFTTDGSGDSYLKCGTIEGVYPTVDFGITYNPAASFKPQKDYMPYGPSVNSEFYTGWLDHWGQTHSTVDLTKVAKSLDLLLAYGANINMYMFEGGTNFGYWNGANYPKYQPQPTSYDYDAPLTEGGDITDKYLALRQVIYKYTDVPEQPLPPNTPKAAYGKVQMQFVGMVQDVLDQLSPEGPVKSEYPLTMEAIGQYQGYVMYRHVLKGDTPSEPKTLLMSGVKDRAVLMLNKVPQGIFDRNGRLSMNITLKVGMTIDILVENMGHINFGSGINNDSKGLVSNVTFGGSLLTGWEIYKISPEKFNVSKITEIKGSGPMINGNLTTPSIYVGKINVPDQPADTFLDVSMWTKGQAIIGTTSNFNLGRYWPSVGPQVRLYVPKPSLNALPATNSIILFELENSPCSKQENCYVDFSNMPYINGTAHGPSSYKQIEIDEKFPFHLYH